MKNKYYIFFKKNKIYILMKNIDLVFVKKIRFLF